MLKRKHKSDPKKDENEKGARAMIIEEGIATWIPTIPRVPSSISTPSPTHWITAR
nr:hypothetical protein [Pseudomonas sp. BW16M2]